ncbi:MAG: MBL fold metallo-hydrolase [Dehalococcoidia bacterium]|nr:MBL fold metallo-hydrolase [Dehalococcoidia bacterium]
MKPLHIGDITVTKAVEQVLEMERSYMFPQAMDEIIAPHRDWLSPHFLLPDGKIRMSIHSYVVKTPRYTMLVDTCYGNDKKRAARFGNMLNTPYLRDLAAAGVPPESVDFVFCTHLHADHTGWNTRLQDGRWVPTFPNAKYIMSHVDWDYWQTRKPEDFGYDAIQDSVLPVVASKQAMFVDEGYEIDRGVTMELMPGHTPGAAALNIASQGHRAAQVSKAVCTGDMFHHAMQLIAPQWGRADVDTVLANKTRRGFFERYAGTGVVVLPAHFPDPTAGRIERRGDAFMWTHA